MSRLIHLLFLIVIFAANLIEAAKWKCDSSAPREADQLMAKLLIYGQAGLKFPVNKEEMKKYCRDENAILTKLEEYKNQCLKNTAKQVTAIVVFSMKEYISSLCKNLNSKQTKNVLSSASCANSASNTYLGCQNDFIKLMLAVENLADEKAQFAQICCAYFDSFECMKTRASQFRQCTAASVGHNIDYIKGMFASSVRQLCAGFHQNPERCDNFKYIKGSGRLPKNVWLLSAVVRVFGK